MNNKPKLSKRRLARINAMQAIYQWQHTADSSEEIILQFRSGQHMHPEQADYFQVIVNGVINNVTEIDETMRPHLDRSLNSLNPVELAILRIAIFELMQRMDIPYVVIINEALEITKEYGSSDGFKYVNAVLDKLVPSLRTIEYQARVAAREKKH